MKVGFRVLKKDISIGDLLILRNNMWVLILDQDRWYDSYYNKTFTFRDECEYFADNVLLHVKYE